MICLLLTLKLWMRKVIQKSWNVHLVFPAGNAVYHVSTHWQGTALGHQTGPPGRRAVKSVAAAPSESKAFQLYQTAVCIRQESMFSSC